MQTHALGRARSVLAIVSLVVAVACLYSAEAAISSFATGEGTVDVGSIDIKPKEEPFTLGAWFKTTSTGRSSIFKCVGYWELRVVPNGAIEFQWTVPGTVTPDATCSVTSATGFNDGNWHMAVGYRQKIDDCGLSIDGGTAVTTTSGSATNDMDWGKSSTDLTFRKGHSLGLYGNFAGNTAFHFWQRFYEPPGYLYQVASHRMHVPNRHSLDIKRFQIWYTNGVFSNGGTELQPDIGETIPVTGFASGDLSTAVYPTTLATLPTEIGSTKKVLHGDSKNQMGYVTLSGDWIASTYTIEMTVMFENGDADAKDWVFWGGQDAADLFQLGGKQRTVDNRWRPFFRYSTSQCYVSNDYLSKEVFYHIAGTYDKGTGTAKLYINGVETTRDTGTTCDSIATTFKGLGYGYNGGVSTPGGPNRMWLSQGRLWNVVRTQAEIMAGQDVWAQYGNPALSCIWEFQSDTWDSSELIIVNTGALSLTLDPTQLTNARYIEYNAAKIGNDQDRLPRIYDTFAGANVITAISPSNIACNTPQLTLTGATSGSTKWIAFATDGNCGTASRKSPTSLSATASPNLSAQITPEGTYKLCYSIDGGLTWKQQTTPSVLVGEDMTNSPVTAANSPVTNTYSVSILGRLNGQSHTITCAKKFVCTFSSGLSGSVDAVQVGATDEYRCTRAITTPGTYQVSVAFDGQAVTNGVKSFTMSVGPASTASDVQATYDDAVVAGATRTFSITSKDQFSNPRSGTGDSFEVRAAISGGAIPDIVNAATNTASGVYQGSYMPTLAGTYTVSVSVGGQTIVSNNAVSVSAQTTISHALSTYALSASTIAAGATVTLDVTARDQYTNLVPTLGTSAFQATWTHKTEGGLAPVVVNTGAYASNKYPISTSAITVAGDYTLTVKRGGTDIAASPLATFTVTNAAVNAANSLRSGSTGVVINTANRFTITARDAYDNIIPGHTLTAGCTFTGGITGAVSNGPTDGVYYCDYTPTALGTYTVSLTLNSNLVTGSTFSLVVDAGPHDNSKVLVFGGNLRWVEAGKLGSIQLQSRDSSSTNRSSHDLITSIQAILVPYAGGNNVTGTVANAASGGLYDITWNATIAGAYQLHLTNEGTHMAASPYPYSVTQARSHGPAATLLSGTFPSSHVAGTTLPTYALQPRDRFLNNINRPPLNCHFHKEDTSATANYALINPLTTWPGTLMAVSFWTMTRHNGGTNTVVGPVYATSASSAAFKLLNPANVRMVINGQSLTMPSAPVITDGKWHHILAQYNGGTKKGEIFLDGVSYGEQTFTASAVLTSGMLSLGRDITGTPAAPAFDGANAARAWLDDLAIWERSFTATDVQKIQYAQLRGDEANLKNLWTFDECIVTPIRDLKGGMHLTGNGAGTSTAGTALYLQASAASYSTRGGMTNMPTTEITLGGWVKPTSSAPGLSTIISYRCTGAGCSPGNYGNDILLWGSTASIHLWISDQSSGGFTAAAVPANQWTYLTASWRKSDGRVHMTKNGVTAVDTNVAALANRNIPGSGTVMIGCDQDGTEGQQGSGGSQCWDGDLSELFMWRKEASVGDIQHWMKYGFSGNEADLTFYYPMSDHDGRMFYDAGPYKQHQRVQSGTWAFVAGVDSTSHKDGLQYTLSTTPALNTASTLAQETNVLFTSKVTGGIGTEARSYALTLTDKSDFGANAANTPRAYTILPTVAQGAASTAAGPGLSASTAGTNAHVILTARDQYNNEHTDNGETVAGSLTHQTFGAIVVPIVVTNEAAGQYRVTYNATKSGVYTFALTIRGENVNSFPRSVTVSPNVAFGGECTAAGAGLANAVAGVQNTFSVTVRDAFGNQLTTTSSTVTAALTKAGAPTVNAVKTAQSAGVYTMTYTATKAVNYDVNVLVEGQAVRSNPFVIAVTPNAVVATKTIVSGTGATSATAGVQATMTATLRDTYDNQLTQSTETVTAALSTPNVAVNVVAAGNGVYTLTYTAQVAKSYVLDLQVNTVSFGQTVEPLVVAGPVKASESVLTGAGLSSTVAGDIATFNVQARDQFQNLRTVESDTFTANITHATAAYTVDGTVTPGTAGSGQYNVAYNVTLTGSYTLRVYGNGELAGTRTVTVSPAQLTVAYSLPVGSLVLDNQPSVAGTTSSFTVQLKDKFHNNRTTFDTIVAQVQHKVHGASVLASGPTLGNGPAGSGQRTVTYRATVSGNYDIFVRNNAQTVQIIGSPFTVLVNPDVAVASTSFAYGSQLARAEAGKANSFQVQMRDQFQNNMTNGGLTLSASLAHQGSSYTATGVAISGGSNGLYTVAYNATVAGTYTVSVTYGGSLVSGSTYSLVVDPTVTHGVNSVVNAPVGSATAGVWKTFSVQARDAFGNTRTVATDTLTFTSTHPTGASAVANQWLPDAGNSGTYSLRSNHTVSGTWTVNVLVNGAAAIGSPFSLVVNPNIAYGSTSTHDATAAGQVVAGFTAMWNAQVRDAFGNNRTTNDDTVTAQLTHQTQAIAAIDATVVNSGGSSTARYQVSYTPTRSGVYNINLRVNGMPFGTSPFTTLVLAATTSVPDSIAYGAGLANTVAGAAAEFVVQARDRFQNNRTVATDTFLGELVHSTASTAMFNATVTAHGSIAGAYRVQYNATVSGAYSVRVRSLNGTHISGSPFAMTTAPAAIHPPSSVVDNRAWGVLSTAQVVVQSRDAFGNLRSLGASDSFNVRVFVASGELGVTQTAAAAGLYTFEYFATTPGNVNITARTNGQIVGASEWAVVQALGPANFSAIVPDLGTVAGGTQITLTGTNFVNTPKMNVIVGGVSCPMTSFVSSTSIVCTTQAHGTVGSKGITVSNNAGVNTSAANAQFLAHATEVVSLFQPNNGPVYGRTVVTVTGSNFLNSPYLNCKFGSVVSTTAPTFVSSTEILCTSPENIVGDLVFAVANNGQQFVPAVAAAGFFKYIEPFSPLCRLKTELPVGQLERQSKGQTYFPNLAKGASTDGTSPGADINLPGGIVDDDRCCEKTPANQGKYCGIQFQRQFVANMTGLAQAVVKLPRQAFVNEFLTTWFRPCANQPPYYYVDYDVSGNGTWTNLITRVTKSDAISLGTQKPCFFVPSDQEDASICIDFLNSELRATHFRIRFNNTEGVMGKFGTTTDGAWLYEFEVHGIYTDTPEFLDFVNDLSAWPSQPSVASTAIPTLQLRTLNHQREILLANDTATQTATVRLLRGSTLTDVTSLYLAGTKTVNLVGGLATFSNLELRSPPADLYRLQFSTNNLLVEVHTNLTVVIGPAYEVRRTSANPAVLSTAALVNIPAVELRLYDISNSFVGSTDNSTRNVSVSLSSQPGGNPNPNGVLIGTLVGNMSAGLLQISDLQLVKPVPGVYNITLSMDKALTGGTESVSVAITIQSGVPYSLALNPGVTGTYASSSTVAVNQIGVRVLDISGTQTSVTFGSAIKIAVSTNGSLVLGGAGASGCTVSNGACTVPIITLNKPVADTYLLSLTSSTVLNATTVLTINIGSPVELRFRAAAQQSHPSVGLVNLTSIVVDAYDIGGTFVGATDGSRTVVVSSLNGTALTMQGTLSSTMTAGTVDFNAIQLVAPSVGTYVLSFASAGLSGLQSTVEITVGPAAKLDVTSSTEVVVETFTINNLPSVNVRALDTGNFFVGTSDTANRTVVVTVSPSGSGLSAGATGYMVNGTVVLSQLVLSSPQVKNYTMTISTAGLQSTSLKLAVLGGNPVSLVMSPTTVGPYSSENLVRLANMSMSLLDAGNTVVEDARAVNTIARLFAVNSSSAATVVGTTTIVMQGATVVFHNISLYRPKADAYTLIFGVGGMANATVDVTIQVGAPYSLRVTGGSGAVLPTRVTVQVPKKDLEVLDVGGTLVTAGQLAVNVSTSVPLGGLVQRTSFQGVVSFAGLTMDKPANQTYVLTFSSTGLLSATSTLVVTPGVPYALSSAETVIGPLPSVAKVNVHAGLVLSVLDTANNVVPSTYADSRTIAVAQTSGAESGVLGGDLSVALVNASQGVFDNITLTAPSVGNYTLQFTSAGLLPVDVIVRIKVGPAVTMAVLSPASATASVASAEFAALPTVHVRAYDAGNTFVAASDIGTRPVLVSIDNGAVLNGTTSVSMVAGEVQISGLSIKFAPRGTYTLTVSSAGLTNTSIAVTVTPGSTYKLSAANVATPNVVSLSSSLFGTVRLSTLDAGSGVATLGNTGRVVSVSLNDTSQKLVGSTTVGVSASGEVNLDGLGLAAPRVGAYLLTFTSAGALGVTRVVTVSTGPPASLYRLPGQPTPSVRTVANTLIPPINIRSLDVGSNMVTMDAARVVSVAVGNGTAGLPTAPLFNQTQATMVNGNVTFDNTIMHSPPANTYTLRFTSTGLVPVDVELFVSIGPAVSLNAVTSGITAQPSEVLLQLPSFQVRAVDSAGVPVGGIDVPSTRTVSVWASDSRMSVPATLSMQNGVAQAVNMSIARPPVGLYVVTFGTPGLANVSVTFNVTLGAAIEQRVENGGVQSLASAVNTVVGNITIGAYEAGGAAVNASDNQVRSVRAYSSTLSLGGALVHQMVNGRVVVTGLIAHSPTQGSHTIVFASAGLSNTSVSVTIVQGAPVKLTVLAYTTTPHPSAFTVPLNTIRVQLRDAGDGLTSLGAGQSVQVRTDPAVPLTGTKTVNVTGNEATFSSLQLNAPSSAASPFVLEFVGLGGLSGVALDKTRVFVSTGAPVRMSLPAGLDQRLYPCADPVTVVPFEVRLLDAAGVFVGTVDSANVRPLVGVNMNSSSVVASVPNSLLLRNGTVTVTGLTLARPRVGVYWFNFTSPGLGHLLSRVQITTGPAVALVSSGGTKYRMTTGVRSNLPGLTLVTVDIGGNSLGIADPAQRRVEVELVSSVGSYDRSTDSFVPLRWGGTTTEFSLAGQVRFLTLFMERPRVGQHVLRVVSSGLQSELIELNVTTGSAEQLVVDGNRTMTVTYAGAADGGVLVSPPIKFQFVDAGRSLVSDAPQDTLRMQANIVVPGVESSATAQGSSSGLFVPVTGRVYRNGLVNLENVVVNTSNSLTISNGFGSVGDIRLTGYEGPYGLQFESTSFGSVSVLVWVMSGPPASFIVLSNGSRSYNNSGPLAEPPTFRLLDRLGNEANQTGVVMLLDISPSVRSLQGTSQASDSNGVIRFSSFQFVGKYGFSFSYSFTSVPDIGSLTIPNAVTVDECNVDNAHTVSDELGYGCKCQKGYFLAAQFGSSLTCVECPTETYQSLIGQVECTACPVSMDTEGKVAVTSQSECKCIDGFYERIRNDQRTCLKCTPGAECRQGQTIQAQKGFFGVRPGTDQYIACPEPDACKGGANSTCNTGYRGPLCAVCEDGYGKFGEKCLICGDNADNWVLVVLFFTAATAMLLFLIRTATGEKSQASIMMKILLNYMQVLAFIGEFRLNWASETQGLFSTSNLALFSLKLHPIDCATGWTYFDQLNGYMMFPVFTVFVPLVVYGGTYLWATRIAKLFGIEVKRPNLEIEREVFRVNNEMDRDQLLNRMKERMEKGQKAMESVKKMPFDKAWRYQMRNMYALTLMVVLFIAHPMVSKAVFQIFNCIELEGGARYLEADMRIDCSSETYLYYLNTWGYLMVFGYCMGVLLVGLGILMKNRKRLRQPTVMARYRFLYDGYSKKRYFWEIVIMTRKLMVVAIIVRWRSAPLTQLYAGLWMCMAALVLHLYARPFAEADATHLETMSLGATTLTLMTGLMFYSSETTESDHYLISLVLLVLNVGTLSVFGLVIVREFIRVARSKKIVQEMEANLAKQLEERRIHNEKMAEREKLLKVFDTEKEASAPKRGRGMTVLAANDADARRASRALIVRNLIRSSTTGGPKSMVHALESLEMLMHEPALRAKYVQHVQSTIGGTAEVSQTEKALWACMYKYMQAVHEHPDERDRLAEIANEVVEEYLDEDCDDPVDVEYGVVVEILSKLNNGVVTDHLFDQVIIKRFDFAFESFKSTLSNLTDGPSLETRLESMATSLADNKLRGRLGKFVSAHADEFGRSARAVSFCQAVVAYRDGFEGWSGMQRYDEAMEILHRFFDDDEDEYLEEVDFGMLTEQQHQLDSMEEAQADAFDELMEWLFVKEFVEWRKEMMDMGELALL